MPVDAPYPEYHERSPDWETCRDVFAGARRVKEKGTRYLPMPDGMTDAPAAYRHYLERADFFNGFGRAVQGLHGMVFRKDPEVTLPRGLEDFEDSLTDNGRSILRLARWATSEELKVGRVGLFVDAPNRKDPKRQVTAAEFRQLNLRPYVATYCAEDVYEARYHKVMGRRQLVRVRLREHVDEDDPHDEFATRMVKRYRVLELVPARAGDPESPHHYQQRVFVERNAGAPEPEGDVVIPVKADGNRWNRIPFVLIDADGEPDDGEIARPPMLDLALKTISLYRTLADLEHLAFFCGFPQPCTKMWGGDASELKIGGQFLWNFMDPGADAWYMSHDGRGSETLEKLADRKRQEIALLGARMLEPDRRGVEAAATAMIHRQGEVSVLQALALLVSEGLSQALGLIQEWMGVAGEQASVELNTDYVPTGVTPQMFAAVFEAYVAGKITDEMWYNFLIEGEVASTSETFEQFMLAIRDASDERLPAVDLSDADDAGDEEDEVPEAAE